MSHFKSYVVGFGRTAFFLMTLTATIISCDNHLEQIEIDDEARPDIFLQNGILNFESQEIFENTVKKMQSMTEEEMMAWSSNYDFESLMLNFNKAKRLQSEIFNKMENLEAKATDLSDAEKEAFIVQNRDLINSISDEYNSFKSGYSYLRFEDDLVTGMKIQNYFASPLVNAEGIVKVGDFLYQYTNDDLKIIRDEGLGSLTDLKNGKTSDLNREIYISSDSDAIQDFAKGRTAEEVIDEDRCSFAFDSDRSGDKYANAYLKSKLIQYPKYKTVQRTTCYCVEWSYSSSGSRLEKEERDMALIAPPDGEPIYCIKEECTTRNVQVFSHWELEEIHVTTQLSSYKESCKGWWIFEVCKTEPKKVSVLEMEVLSGGISFPSNNPSKMVGYDVSSLSHIGVYDDPDKFYSYVYHYPRPGETVRVNFVVNEDINGGFANCVNQVQL